MTSARQAQAIAWARRSSAGPLRAPLRAAFASAVVGEIAAARSWTHRRAVEPYACGDVTVVVKTFERPATLRRMLASVGTVFAGPILVADDSRRPVELDLPGARVLTLPFDSGIGAGRTALLAAVETEFVLMCDDDFILLPDFDIARAAAYLRRNPGVDLYGGRVINLPQWTSTDYHQQALLATPGTPLERQGTVIDGLPVLYKVPNFYLAHTAAARSVGYDPLLKRIDHNDFFTTAYGRIVCVQDRAWVCLHAQTPFDAHYQSFRTDLSADFTHLAQKWGSTEVPTTAVRAGSGVHLTQDQLRRFHAAAIAVVAGDAAIAVDTRPAPETATLVRVTTPNVTGLREALVRAGWTRARGGAVRHPLWGEAMLEAGAAPIVTRADDGQHPPGWIAPTARATWATQGEDVLGAVLPGGPVLELSGPTALAAAALIGTRGAPLTEVVNHVVEAFPDAPDNAGNDLRMALLGLVEAGLFTLAPPASSSLRAPRR